MGLDWLTVCADDTAQNCVQPIQVAYLVAVLVGVILFAVIARRSRDLSTATLTLMVVAIAINIAVGSLIYALRLPIYLDSIGTVLVGALAGPWAGALTGLLANLIWSILPVPGGAGPTAAFFAPVAAVIGLMAGFWASRGVFRLRSRRCPRRWLPGARVRHRRGRCRTPRRPGDDRDPVRSGEHRLAEPVRHQGPRVIRCHRRRGRLAVTAGRSSTCGARTRGSGRYLVAATAISAGVLVFAFLRLLFGPTGYFSTRRRLAR